MTGEGISGGAGELAINWFVSGWAQASQNRAPSDRGAPQFGQYRFTSDINTPLMLRVGAQGRAILARAVFTFPSQTGWPHAEQNPASGLSCTPHFVQN
jgi:hypothetical protein